MWKRTKTRVAAFTLMECLLALLMISGGLLVFEGLSKLLQQEIHYQASSVEKDWLVFVDQFRAELEGVQLVKVENNRLYVDKAGQQLAFGKSSSDDFRKTDHRGRGYQPMLYHLEHVKISQTGHDVYIDFTFENGWERSFVYRFEEEK